MAKRKRINQNMGNSFLEKMVFQKTVRDEARAVTEKTVTAMFNILLVAVRDEFGVGQTRMKRLGNRVTGLLEALEKDELELDLLDNTLQEEIGINADNFLQVPGGKKND